MRAEHRIFPNLNIVITAKKNVAKTLPELNMKIGSTTGFTKVMVDILLKDAKAQGSVDSYIFQSPPQKPNQGIWSRRNPPF